MLALNFDSRNLNIVGKEIVSDETRIIWKLGFIFARNKVLAKCRIRRFNWIDILKVFRRIKI